MKLIATSTELRNAFYHPVTNEPKQIVCIRVDGASDEGPSHLEVQFWWREFHLTHGTHSSGSSYFNRVELQNGCLVQAHSNLYIPSTLRGSCTSESGTINQEKLRNNREAATSKLQELRPLLNVFLKDSQQKNQDYPEAWSFFNAVWEVREKHFVAGLPENYLFYLRCCLQPECPHPLCQQKQKDPDTLIPATWHPTTPPVTALPLPVVDVNWPWGGSNCTECTGT